MSRRSYDHLSEVPNNIATTLYVFPQEILSKPEKQKLKKSENEIATKPINQLNRITALHDGKPALFGPRFLDRATSVGIEEHRRAPFT